MSTESKGKSAISLISDILDRMIDTQQSSTEAVSNLKAAIDETRRDVTTHAEVINEINGHFKNGFRYELKESIKTSTQQLGESLNKKLEDLINVNKDLATNLKNLIQNLERPFFWIKLILTTLGATAVAIAGIVALLEHS